MYGCPKNAILSRFYFYILTILEIVLKAIIVAIVMIAIISMPEVIWNNKSSL